jgi:hypothetical protein
MCQPLPVADPAHRATQEEILIDGVEQVVVGVGVLAERVAQGQDRLLQDAHRKGGRVFLHVQGRQAALDGGIDEAGGDELTKGIGHRGGVRRDKRGFKAIVPATKGLFRLAQTE